MGIIFEEAWAVVVTGFVCSADLRRVKLVPIPHFAVRTCSLYIHSWLTTGTIACLIHSEANYSHAASGNILNH